MQKKNFLPILALAVGHLVTDLQAGALPIVLPHLKELFTLSYSQLAAIVLTQNITSSVIQPVFGYITDKRSMPVLLPFCAAMAGAGFAAIGWVSSYSLILLTVIIIGIASATYHPQASKTVNFLSDENSKAKNMGIFSLGGNAGMAVGSILMTFLIGLQDGIHNTMYFILPGLLVFGLMMKYMPDYKRVNAEHSLKKAAVQIKAASEKLSYTGMFILLFFIFMRSTIHTGLSTYLPLFFMKFRGSEAIFASALVSAFLLGGVAGTYTGAVLSDRLGARRIILGSIILSIPTIWLISHAGTPFSCRLRQIAEPTGSIILSIPTIWLISHAGTEIGAMLAVVASGFFIIGSFATTIVLAQTMLPDNVGMAAGLTIGFSVGMGGFGVTILGFIADNFGLPLVMQIVTWLPVAAAIIALKIPIPASLRK